MVELTVHIHQMIGSVGQSSLDHKGAFPRPPHFFSFLFKSCHGHFPPTYLSVSWSSPAW